MPQSDPAPLSVVIADPDALARTGLRAILGADPRFRVAGVTEGDPAALVSRHRPDLLILDPARDEDGGRQRIRDLVTVAEETRICVYTDAIVPRAFLSLMVAGAAGCFLKRRTDAAKLGDLLLPVGRGLAVCAEPWILALVRASLRDRAASGSQPAVVLPEREWAVLRELATGAPDKLIAAHLGMSCSTVRTHVARLRVRFAAESRAHLIASAIRAGALTA
jgi:DNA-binding NarL/FixJ family response regulator